ncbi:MAG: exodeoxyribonuclease VII small subunit [Eubacterium sp.]|nr:exodeoxyribonuclease VII small subunit [Eubacterium sp.]
MPAKKSDASDAKEAKETKETKESLSIEESLARIEAIIQTLESPDTGLQDAMKLYTEGVGLLDDCQKTLEGVEQQLKVLSPEEV